MGNPIKLSAQEEKRLLDYLEQETQEAIRYVLEPLQAQRETWNDVYYGKVAPRMAEWMSHFPILLGATFTDAITARIVNTSFAYKPTWTVEPTADSSWTKVAKAVEQFIEFKVRTEMKLYRELRKTAFECVRLGTGVLLTPWVVEERTVPIRRFFWESEVTYVTKNGIISQSLPVRDFLYPPGYSELEQLPWWARRMYWNRMMLKVEEKRGYYDVPDDVYKAEESLPQFTEEARLRAGESGTPKRILGWEHWVKWDRKDDGDVRRYVVTWHPGTKKILRVEEDTYVNWPLQVFRYGPRDHGLCGLGVMEMTLPFEDALYALYNTLVDNFKIATTSAFKGTKGKGLRPDTVFYPGKLFLLDNPMEDLVPFQMGQPYNLNPQFVNAVWDLGERRAGVSDYALGRESPIVSGRATATGTMALIQEGQRRFDLTIRDFREALDDMGMFVLATSHQRLDPVAAYMVLGEKGKWLQQWVHMPPIPPQFALKMVSSISSIAINKETEKQNALTSFQLLGQYYEKMVQIMTFALNPQTPETLRGVLVNIAQAAAEKLKRVLEAFGEMSPGTYTDVLRPYLGEEDAQPSVEGAPGGVPVPPGMEMGPGTAPGTPFGLAE